MESFDYKQAFRKSAYLADRAICSDLSNEAKREASNVQYLFTYVIDSALRADLRGEDITTDFHWKRQLNEIRFYSFAYNAGLLEFLSFYFPNVTPECYMLDEKEVALNK